MPYTYVVVDLQWMLLNQLAIFARSACIPLERLSEAAMAWCYTQRTAKSRKGTTLMTTISLIQHTIKNTVMSRNDLSNTHHLHLVARLVGLSPSSPPNHDPSLKDLAPWGHFPWQSISCRLTIYQYISNLAMIKHQIDTPLSLFLGLLENLMVQ